MTRKRMDAVLSDVEAAWLAGVIDGEGHLRFDRPMAKTRPDYLYPRLHVSNTVRPFLERAHEITGVGRMYCMNQPKAQPDRRVVWAWITCGQECVDLLNQVFPYLIIKRDKAAEIIASEFARTLEVV